MSEVKQTFTGDISQLERELKRLQGEYARLERENQKLASGSKRASDDERKNSEQRQKALDAEIRKTQELAATRSRLARTEQSLAGFIRQPSGSTTLASFIPKSYDQPLSLAGMIRNSGVRAIPESMRGPREHNQWQQVQLPAQESELNRLLTERVAALGQVAAGYLSVRAILQAYNRDMEEQIRLQRESSEAHRGLAGGQAELFLNTFGQDPATIARYQSEAKRIATQTGVPESAVLQSMARQAGRGVGLNAQQIIEAQEIATRLGRHTPEQIEPLGTVIQQTMRATGKGAEWSAALAQSGAAAAFPGNPVLQSRFLQQALTGSLANIDKPDSRSAEQIFELAAFISQAGGEERGEAGRTSVIAMLAQLEQFREGRGPWEVSIPGRAGKLHPGVKDMPTAPIDAIEWLRANPRQMRRFTDKMSFERHFEGIWRRSLMDPSSQVGKLLAETQQQVSPDVGALQNQLSALERGTPQISLSTQDAQAKAEVEQFKARYSRGAVTSSIRDMRDEAARASARYSHWTAPERQLQQWLHDVAGYVGGDQAEQYVRNMEGMRAGVLQGGNTFMRRPEQLSGEERKVYDLLSKLIEKAEQQITELKKMSTAQPSGSPAAQNDIGRQRER